MALSRRFPRLPINPMTSTLARELDRRYDHVVDNVQAVDEELDIKYTEAAAEPTIGTVGNVLIWKDTGTSKYYLVFKHSGGQVKVEMT